MVLKVALNTISHPHPSLYFADLVLYTLGVNLQIWRTNTFLDFFSDLILFNFRVKF